MLKSSRYSVTFPINGQTFSGEITYEPGVTVVVGRNGTGKTLGTIELWRYLLFGKKALRGPASDYKNMHAEGVFELQGIEYTIKRIGTKNTLWRGDDEIAVGAEAVDKKIVELLGFELDVFDICNASVQKRATQLTQLTPAKRKELIDDVVGLSQNEAVEKECKQQAKLKKLEADTIRDTIVKPEKPTKPPKYKHSSAIWQTLVTAREIEADRQKLITIVDSVGQKPTPPSFTRPDIAKLEKHERCRLEAENERKLFQAKLDAIPSTTYTLAEIEAAEEAQRRGPKLDPDSVTTCPKCEYKFLTEDQQKQIDAWAEPLEYPEDLYGSELLDARTALDRAAERELLVENILAIPHYDDLSTELGAARMLEQQWWRYDREFEEWRTKCKAGHDALQTLNSLPRPLDIAELERSWVAAQVYESALESYEKTAEAYETKTARANTLDEEADGFVLGAKRLAEARRELKAHLAPSLSRIASSLISEMTLGKYNEVSVDENMEIKVNGQDVSTLSGAGETIANIAMRLALGRTLVSGIFPVFLGDELDADADAQYSEAIFEALRNLRSQFKQVIIITHKPHVTADHVIDLNK